MPPPPDPPDRAGTVETLVLDLHGGPGGARGALVTGPPGIGKSTVLGQVAARLTAAGVQVLRTRADELSPRDPYRLVQDLLGLPVVVPAPDDAVERALAAVDARCAAGPVALLVDDAHHADSGSLDVLLRLAAAAHDLRLTLLVARRPLPAREPLDLLAARRDVLAVTLTGLAAADVAALVVRRWGAPPGARLLRWLSATGGNPFHVGELLDDLARREQLHLAGGLVEVDGAALVAPPTLQASVAAHLALLDGAAHDLVQALAVWGGGASVEQLAAVLGLTATALLGPVQQAVTAGVVVWRPDGTLDVAHDLLREVTYDRLAAPLRAVLHRACAAVLESDGAAVTTVTHHVGRGAGEPGSARALQRAASTIASSPTVAADLLEVAAGLAEDPTTRGSITLQRAGALAQSGRWDEAGRVAREGMARSTDAATHATLRMLLVQSLVSAGEVTDALALLDDTAALTTDPAQRRGLADSRRWVLLLGRREPVSDADLPDVAALDAAADPGGRLGTRRATDSVVAFLRGRFTDAVVLAHAAADAAARSAAPFWSDGATTEVLPATMALYAHGPARAAEMLRAGSRAAQVQGKLWLSPYHQLTAAEVAAYTVDVDDAAAEHGAALEAADAAGVGWLTQAVGTCATLEVALGRLDRARDRLDAWRPTGRPEWFGLPHLDRAQALLAEAEGDLGTAVALARRAHGTTATTGRAVWLLGAGPEQARLALRAGDRVLLDRLAADAAALEVSQAGMFGPGPALVLAIAAGDGAAAADAADAYARWGNVPAEALAWEEAACAGAVAGDPRARTWATRALELHQRRGAEGDELRAAARLRGHGMRLGATGPRRRGGTGWESLTRTERRIAELVGQGNSGPEIAALLVVSPRTVQTHASRVLTKLGLRSRVELAAWMVRRSSTADG